MRTTGPWLAAAVVVCSLLGRTAHGAPAEDDLVQSAHELVARYTSELNELAAWCRQRGLEAEAEKTQRWARPADPHKMYVAVLPEQIGPPPLADGAPADQVQWNDRFWKLRRKQSSEMYELAQRAAKAGKASLALDLSLAAVREDPDHKDVRRMLGYQEYRGGWHTAYEVRKLRSGQVWHEKFGWIPRSYVRRYEEGQRYTNGRWIDAEEDAKLHADIRSGWEVETEHYTVLTNHSIPAGVELAVQLERLYRIWQQLFVRYYATEAQVMALFNSGSRGRRVELPRHNVVYFRDREDYNRSLRAAMPNIGISIGVYVESTRRAYFFAGEGSEVRTLYHEATHQLFHESRRVAPDVGRQANFWVIEGIAMFMESLKEADGFYTLGGFEDDRVNAARYRLLHDNFHVPLSELCEYGMQRIHEDPRIATLYSEAAGLTHFLVFYDGGRYRDALISYLVAVYSGRDDSSTLSRLTGEPYSTLDRQYREFLSGPSQTEERQPRP